MSLHNEILNIKYPLESSLPGSFSINYKAGFEDAKNISAELALKADAEINRLQRIEAAAKALIKGKGRFHTEQNMTVLIDAVNDLNCGVE